MNRIKVWPAVGKIVRDERSKKPIAPGAEVPFTRVVRRRIADGDLLTNPPADFAPEPAPEFVAETQEHEGEP